ncbi:hypothetical protein ACWEOZ_29730 [Actinoplanes sp. NPDC004185]
MNGRHGKEPSRSGPAPDAPDDARDWFEPRAAVTEPTQVLPLVAASPPRMPPPMVVARAVIVYQERPRRPWRLWVFTVAIVALTIGVVLGQTAAFDPVYRPAAGAQVEPLPPAPSAPSGPAPSGPVPSTLDQPWPDAAHRITAPLGSVRARRLEVAGASAVLRVRGADLGGNLFDIATTDRSAVPSLTESKQGSRLELTPTTEPGTVGAELQLNTKVAWTLKLAGGTAEQTIDLRAGIVAGIEIVGGTTQLVLQLPEPKGTVKISVSGPVGELVVRTAAGTPVRLRLRGGAKTATVAGKKPRKVKSGGALTPDGWSAARNRYDVVAADPVTSVSSAAF